MIKKTILAFVFLLGSQRAFATTTPWFNSYLLSPSTASTNYALPKGAYQAEATESNAYGVAPTSITLHNLKVIVSTAPDNGAGTQSWTIHFRVEVGNSSPDFSCVISEASTTCSDTSTNVVLTAGQRIDWSIVPSGTPAATHMAIYVDADTSNGETVLVGNTRGNIGTSGTTNGGISGAGNTATESLARQVLPTSGTIEKLYAYLETGTGAGTTRTLTVFKGGSSTALAVTWSNESGLKSDSNSGDNQTVAAGNLFDVQWSLSGTPTNSVGEWGIVFVPTTDGDFALLSSEVNNLSNSSTVYYAPSGSLNQGSSSADNSASVQIVALSTSFYISGLYVNLSIAPNNGAGTQTVTSSLRVNGADMSPTFAVAISEASTSGCTNNGGTGGCGNSSGTYTPSANDQIDIQYVPTGTPVSNIKASWGILGHSTAGAVVLPGVNIKLKKMRALGMIP